MRWLWRRVLLCVPRIYRSQRPRLQGSATLGEFPLKFSRVVEVFLWISSLGMKNVPSTNVTHKRFPASASSILKTWNFIPRSCAPPTLVQMAELVGRQQNHFTALADQVLLENFVKVCWNTEARSRSRKLTFFLHALNWNFRRLQHWDRCKLERTFVRYFLLQRHIVRWPTRKHARCWIVRPAQRFCGGWRFCSCFSCASIFGITAEFKSTSTSLTLLFCRLRWSTLRATSATEGSRCFSANSSRTSTGKARTGVRATTAITGWAERTRRSSRRITSTWRVTSSHATRNASAEASSTSQMRWTSKPTATSPKTTPSRYVRRWFSERTLTRAVTDIF